MSIYDETKQTYWRTYTLAQNNQIYACISHMLPKLTDEEHELAEKILRRLKTQTRDQELVPFSYEEDDMLDAVEQGLWRK